MKKLTIVAFLLLFSLTFGDISWGPYAAITLEKKYQLEDDLIDTEKLLSTQIWGQCTPFLMKRISIDKDNIAKVTKIYELSLKANTGPSRERGGIEKEVDAINIELVTTYRDSESEGDKYNSCIDEQQKLFDLKDAEYKKLLDKKDFSGCIKILEEMRRMLHANTTYFTYIEDSIAFVNETKKAVEKETSDAQKLATEKAIAEKARLTKLAEQKALNEQKKLELRNSSDGNYLASAGIVNQQSSEEGYRLNSDVLRQEVVGMAAKVGKFNLPEGYTCKNIFSDVSSAKPNSWACRAIEIVADNGVVSKLNKTFRPESNITRAEALAILLKAAGIQVNTGSTSNFSDVTVDWQINVINTALSYGFIDAGTSFNPNKNATRGEIFNMAKRIIESQN